MKTVGMHEDQDCKPEPTAPDKEFLTVKQAAAFLNISASIIYRLCITKKLAHYRFGQGGGAIRINRAELMDFLKRCHVEDRNGQARLTAPPQKTPYVYQVLDFRPKHACGAITKAGTPCTQRTKEERCHLHRKKNGDVARGDQK